MPTSTDTGVPAAEASPLSSASGSPSSVTDSAPGSTPSSKPFLELMREVQLANQLRLMRDNDQTLALTLASNRVHREQTLQLRAAQVAQAAAEVAPMSSSNGKAISLPEPDMGDINVSSPRTETHYHLPQQQAQPQPQPKPDPAPIATPAASGPDVVPVKPVQQDGTAVAPAQPAPAAGSGAAGYAKAGVLAALLVGAGLGGGYLLGNKPAPANPSTSTGTTTNVTKGVGSTIDLVSPPTK